MATLPPGPPIRNAATPSPRPARRDHGGREITRTLRDQGAGLRAPRPSKRRRACGAFAEGHHDPSLTLTFEHPGAVRKLR